MVDLPWTLKYLELIKKVTCFIFSSPKKPTFDIKRRCTRDKKKRKIVEIDYDLKDRNSCSQMFLKIGVLKNFANFTGKHLCWSLFLIKL